jgi:uncharacterized repeat protein (TIGR01451 family)
VRRRPILLAAAAVAAGLTALGTVVAQTPAGGAAGLPRVAPGATNPRPPGSSLPSHPAGQQGTRPRLTSPVVAGPDGVRPAGYEMPLPNMEPVRPAAGTLPPPSVTIDPSPEPKDSAPPAGVDPLPLVPVPPVVPPTAPGIPGIPTIPAIPLPPTDTSPAGAGIPVAPLALPGGDIGLSPASTPVHTPPVATAGLPFRVTQSVTLEAVCPETINFGQEFRYELIVRNGGTAGVAGVRIEDELPAGAKYVGSDPPAELAGDRLVWAVGALEAGAERRIAVRVKPADEGEVTSRATVTYTAAVEARTRVTRPRIAVAVTGSELCRAGEDTIFQIKLSNTGTGPAPRMVLQAQLADGLAHPQGQKIEAELANLPPGESKTVPLKVSAARAGAQWCQVTVAVEGCPDATGRATVNVVEPLLQVAQRGPAKCLVRAEPVYEITLSNPGTAATDPVTVYTVLPEGFEYVQAGDGATYTPNNRAVVWKLPGLTPGGSRTLSLKLRAAAAAEGTLRTIAQAMPEQPAVGTAGAVAVRPAGRTLEAKTETAVQAEGVAAVRFEVTDLEDPVEAGKEAVYEIRVTNQGTGVCTNVQLVAAMGEGTAYAGSSGPTQVKAQGQHLVFDPIPTLAVKGEAVYRVRVKGTAAGESRFRVQLTSDQMRNPVVKEESTRFYKQ